MKSIKFDKSTQEFQIMMDWWKLLQEDYEIETEEDWDKLIQDINLLSDKYDHCDMITDLNLYLVDGVERRYKNGKDKEHI